MALPNLHSAELLLLVLMGAIVAIAGVARKFSLSWPIVLVIAGLLCAPIPGAPHIYLLPDIVFLVFLPPLLFSAAWQTSWRDFRYNLVSIGSLAIGLVFFTSFGVAFVAPHLLPSFDWRSGFLLGAVVSTTDAVAAASIAKRIGIPKRILDLLEGESLVNDATGLLALEFGADMIARGSSPSLEEGALRFLWLLGGGILVGLVIGWLISCLERWVDDGPVEVALTLIVAYGTYLAGESVKASGVIAVVTCGLYMSRKSSTFFAPTSRLQAIAVWEAIEFLLNGFVFFLIGMQLPYVLSAVRQYTPLQLVSYGLGFAGLLVLLRLLWMYPGAFMASNIRNRLLHQNYSIPSAPLLFVLGWSGMRGVVSLAAASALPYTLANGAIFPQRNLIVFLTFAVILVTLLLQGLTLSPLVRLLGLTETRNQRHERTEARRVLAHSAMEYLRSGSEHEDAENKKAYEDAMHRYKRRLNALDFESGAHDSLAMNRVLLGAVHAERDALLQLRDRDQVDDETYRLLERELDLNESTLQLADND